MNEIKKYFPEFTPAQLALFERLLPLYVEWNEKINVISRKDIDNFSERHVLHSLGIAKAITFAPGSRILDVGTGGGFPGIPLAIAFPDCHFYLVDSIGKKIQVVNEVVAELGLKNVTAQKCRAEDVKGKFDFVVSRAVTRMEKFVPWVKNKIANRQINPWPNGIMYLKGGELQDELRGFPEAHVFDLSKHFEGEFFETKRVVYLPL